MDDMPLLLPAKPVRLMDRLRARLLAYRTEQTCCTWIKDFICFHRLAKPESLSAVAVDTFRNALKTPMGAAKISIRCVVLLDKGLRRTPKAMDGLNAGNAGAISGKGLNVLGLRRHRLDLFRGSRLPGSQAPRQITH